MELSSTAVSSNTKQDSTGLYGSACDTCRRRRVKCNGNQPCDRCTRSNVSCTYGSVSGRMSAVSYARHLEQKIAELQSLLNQQPGEPSPTTQGQILDMLIGIGDGYVYRIPETCSSVFYGGFGGFSELRLVSNAAINWSKMAVGRISPTRDLVEALETTSFFPSTGFEIQVPMILPSKQKVQSLVAHASKTALICHDCLDFDDFGVKLDRLYSTDPEDYEAKDKSFLILVYALVALGRRYMPSTEEDELSESGDTVKFRGLAYFRYSYELLLRLSSYDLDAIRAVICQVRYFSSLSMISKAYSHICIGISTALRMGLHITGQQMRSSFTADELYQRRKVFATLNMMDIYLSSTLGMPNILKDADLEQTLSLPEDELHDGGASSIKQYPNSPVAETISCQKINLILAKVLESRYKVGRKAEQSSSDPEEAYTEHYDLVAARELELEEWHNSLPALHENPSDKRALQAQLILRLWHSLAQIVLYRPFLHYLARTGQDPKFNIRGYECASTCVRAAMQAIWVIEAINTNDLLHEGYWVYMYMLGYAASILTFFVTHSVRKATMEESVASAIKAKNLLELLAKYNLSARRLYDSLSVVLDTLPLT